MGETMREALALVVVATLSVVHSDAMAIPVNETKPALTPPKTMAPPPNGPLQCSGGPATAPSAGPTVTWSTPKVTRPGKELTITGANFGGATVVSFIQTMPFGPGETFSWFDVPCVISADGKSITVSIVPTMNADAYPGWRGFKARVKTPAGTIEYASAVATVKPPVPPTFTKPSGVPGDVVNLVGGTYYGDAVVKFNGVLAQKHVYPNPNTNGPFPPPGYNPLFYYAVTVPGGARTGPVTVETAGGIATSTTSFVVNNPLAPKVDVAPRAAQ